MSPSSGHRPQDDEAFERAIGFASDLIRIPSPPGGEEAVARRVVEEMERLRFDEVWTDAVGNVIGVIRGQGERSPVMLNSHLDVVDPGDPSTWERDPYGGEIADGFLHGRGAMDIKGPLALQTHAAARFVDARPAGDVIVAHTVLEERGGWGMAHLMEAGEVRPAAVVLGEATAGDICIGHRGRAELFVDVCGLAGHASAPDRARNPLDGVGSVLDALRSFATERLSAEDPVLGRSTAVATDVVVEPASRNVIPDRARVVLDWRVLPDLDADGAVRLLRAHLHERVSLADGLSLDVAFATERQHTWTGREETRRMFSPGYVLSTDHPVATAAAEAVGRSTGAVPLVRPWRFATDGGHTCGESGIPTIGYAPGEERHAHTNTERLELKSAREAFEAYPALIRALFDAQDQA